MKRILFLTSMVLLIVHPVFALSCIPSPVAYNYISSKVVFVGEVKTIEDLGRPSSMFHKMKVNFNVQEVFKGEVPNSISIIENAYWGGRFKKSRKYLIFASLNEGELLADVCSGTKDMEYVDAEFEEIERVKEFTAGDVNRILKGEVEIMETTFIITKVAEGKFSYEIFDKDGVLTQQQTISDDMRIMKMYHTDGINSYTEQVISDGKVKSLKTYDLKGVLIYSE